MTQRWLSLVALGGIFLLAAATRMEADDLQGAAKLLEKLNAAPKTPNGPAPTHDDFAHLNKDLQAFSKQAASLAPQEAARQWLALFDRGMALPNGGGQMGGYDGASPSVFGALPGPESWPDLQKLVEARASTKQTNPLAQAVLLLIVHTLNNDEGKQWADLAAMASSQAGGQTLNSGMDVPSTILMLGSKLSAVSGQPDEVEKFWTRTFDQMDQPAVNPNAGGFNPVQIEVPDLVTLLGAAKAEPLLLRALLSPHVMISQIDGKETQRVARKLALVNVEKLHQPPWFLTQSLEGSDLYEALLQRFPADANAQIGAIYHVLALVVQGKSKEAVDAVATVSTTNLESAVDQASQAGYGMQVYDFLRALLEAHPENDSWSTYVNLAAQTGHAPEALQFVKETLAKKDLSNAARAQVLPVLYKALLGVDQVDEGVEQLRALIKLSSDAVQSTTGTLGTILNSFGMMGDTQQLAGKITGWDIQLAKLGHLLKRDALETEGLDDARLRSPKDELISYLTINGRNAEAEQLLFDEIVEQAAQAKGTPQSDNVDRDWSGASQQELVKLAQVYYNAGRWADILTLLDKVPGWNAKDLVSIAKEKDYAYRYPRPSLGLMAARALAETGHADQARPILDYVLQVDAWDDAAYELLLKIGQGDLVAKLGALYQQDQFENRPLIWKAIVLLQQGKIAEAEATCKAAIAVDPSDGETGKGDRMRVYSVMADICAAKKDDQQATFFRNVVKAIRLSEDADDYYDAGLLTRAVGMYGQALDLFSDAYCIQSRIARQLAQLGRMEEAAVHYRKAFELMPVSFGRMESHCFGCERAFEGKTATDIAEKTFTDMLAKDPKKPQLYYLLGYLYKEQERYPEALVNFQKAAELDPDYINAWGKITEVGEDCQLNPDLRDAAVFNVLRLDPAGRHTSPNTENVRELARLWQAEEASRKSVPPVPASIYSLKASAAEQNAMEEQMKKMSPNGPDAEAMKQLQEEMNARMMGGVKDENTPREAVLRNGVITAALQLFQ